jgi:hypothetical protein
MYNRNKYKKLYTLLNNDLIIKYNIKDVNNIPFLSSINVDLPITNFQLAIDRKNLNTDLNSIQKKAFVLSFFFSQYKFYIKKNTYKSLIEKKQITKFRLSLKLNKSKDIFEFLIGLFVENQLSLRKENIQIFNPNKRKVYSLGTLDKNFLLKIALPISIFSELHILLVFMFPNINIRNLSFNLILNFCKPQILYLQNNFTFFKNITFLN